MVEHSAVNRRVVGSSPTRGVHYKYSERSEETCSHEQSEVVRGCEAAQRLAEARLDYLRGTSRESHGLFQEESYNVIRRLSQVVRRGTATP